MKVQFEIQNPRYEHLLCQALSNNKPPKQSCMNKELGITPDVKVLIRGLNSTTVIRLIDGKTTCGKLKSELNVSRMMSSGKFLKDDYIFMNNEIIHAFGSLRGGMKDVGHTFLVNSDLILDSQNYEPLRKTLYEQHMPGTREWAVEDINRFFASSSTLFCIMGAAGTGKSVITALILKRLEEKKSVQVGDITTPVTIGAIHFCRHDAPAFSSASSLLSSLSAQCCQNIHGFKDALALGALKAKDALEKGDVDGMFETLIASPLRIIELTPPEGGFSPIVMVIDALDELPKNVLQAILNLLSKSFISLPKFIKLLVTSRELEVVKKSLRNFRPLELVVDELHNRQDIRMFLSSVAAGFVVLDLSTADIEIKVKEKFPEVDVIGKLGALQEPLTKSKQSYDVAAERIEKEVGYKELCAIAEINAVPALKQDIGDNFSYDDGLLLSMLMKDAGEALPILKRVFAVEWEVSALNAKLEVPVKGTEMGWVDRVFVPGLKGEARAKEKTANDYEGNLQCLKDLARLSLEYDSCERMFKGIMELRKVPGLEIVGLKNKYAFPTPMGYRDFNLSVKVTLSDGRKHICEVQINLKDMLIAKKGAHIHYEVVRTKLPELLGEGGGAGAVKVEEVEKFIMKMLQSSVLNSAVKSLEKKAEGLFIYARLLQAQLEEIQRETGGRKVDFAKLGVLPSGLSEMYDSNFQRTFAEDGSWDLSMKIVAMISVAREPLPESLVEKIVGESEYRSAKIAMSLLFPAREGRLHVMHKSVIDWLTDEKRKGEKFWISDIEKSKANTILAKQLWLLYQGWRCCSVNDSWDYVMQEDEKYAVQFGHLHFKNALFCGEGNIVANLWHDCLLERRSLTPFEQVLSMPSKAHVSSAGGGASGDVREKEDLLPKTFQLCSQAATAACGLLIMRHAKMGRIRQFTAELRELLADIANVEAKCEKTQQLRRLLEDQVSVLGCNFNNEFKEIKKEIFKDAASIMFSNVPMTSPLNNSLAATEMCFLKPGDFAYNMTLPHKIGNNAVLMELQGHSDSVTSVAFSSDGSRIVSGSDDKTVKIWNAATGEVENTLQGHSDYVTSVAFSSDGSRIVSGSADKTVKILNAATGEVERKSQRCCII